MIKKIDKILATPSNELSASEFRLRILENIIVECLNTITPKHCIAQI